MSPKVQLIFLPRKRELANEKQKERREKEIKRNERVEEWLKRKKNMRRE